MSEIERLRKTICSQQGQIDILLAENRLLRDKVDHLVKLVKGFKSEKLDPAQLQLMLEGIEPKKPEPAGEDEPAADQNKSGQTKTKRQRRTQLPADLPTKEVEIIPDEVRDNPDGFHRIGEKRTEKLDVNPTSYRRIVYVRGTYVPKDPRRGRRKFFSVKSFNKKDDSNCILEIFSISGCFLM